MMDAAFAAIGIIFGFGACWMWLGARSAGTVATLRGLREQLDTALRERTEMHERAVQAEAEKRLIDQRLKDQQEQMKLEFQNTSNKLFETITQKFSTQSEKQIGDLLNPLRERIGEFQKLVVDSFSTQGKEQHTLKSEIEKIVLQTDSLTKALRGDNKAQGNWGEVMLERILEESGLQKGIGYITQGSSMNLSDAEGGKQRPDVVVNLPDGKHVIIDSKVSLTSYDRFCGEATDALRDGHQKEFLRSVRTHVMGLSGKKYQENEKLQTPDFVFLFMPIEGAYALAVQQDRELHSFAWDKKVVIVCPSTLFASLRTIASLWQIEASNRNAQEIARQGGALYDKFAGFIDDMGKIGKQMTTLNDTYESAMNKLSTGTGNLIGRAEKLKQLGAKTTKSLPKTGDADDKIVMLSDAAENS